MFCSACGHDHSELEGCNLVLPLDFKPVVVESPVDEGVQQSDSLVTTGLVQSIPPVAPEVAFEITPETFKPHSNRGYMTIAVEEYERLKALEQPCAVCERKRISNRNYQRRIRAHS